MIFLTIQKNLIVNTFLMFQNEFVGSFIIIHCIRIFIKNEYLN